MIDFNALFKVSYGLYIVSSGNKEKGNGYISNTFFQVTSEPPQFATCCNKNNLTAEFIEKTGFFAVSVLHQETDADIYGRFHYRSGRDINKLEGIKVQYGQSGVPVVMEGIVAFLECKVVNKFDVGSHWLFIGELIDAQLVDDISEPITYSYYRNIRKGLAPKNAPTYIDKSKLQNTKKSASGIYKCTACGHIYDESKESVKFSDLPDDWKCPDCGADKEDFIEI